MKKRSWCVKIKSMKGYDENMSEDNLTNISGIVSEANPTNTPGPVRENPLNSSGSVDPVPSVYSEEYIDYIERRYQDTINRAIWQNALGEITPEALSSVLSFAVLEWNEGLLKYTEALDELDRQEAALAEFDTDLKERLKVQKRLNAQIRERAKQIRQAMKEARLRSKLEREEQKTAVLQEELANLESESTAMGLH